MGRCSKCIHEKICCLKDKRAQLQYKVSELNVDDEPFNAHVDCFYFKEDAKVSYQPQHEQLQRQLRTLVLYSDPNLSQYKG